MKIADVFLPLSDLNKVCRTISCLELDRINVWDYTYMLALSLMELQSHWQIYSPGKTFNSTGLNRFAYDGVYLK